MAKKTRGQEEKTVQTLHGEVPISEFERTGDEPTAYERRVAEAKKQEAVSSITDLSKLTREQYEVYKSLSPKEQFELGVKTGAIPEGSTYLYTVDGQISYRTPEQTAQIQKAEVAQESRVKWAEEARKVRETRQAGELAEFEKETVRFERANVQLPDGQWIDRGQLASLMDTSPKIYTALVTGGITAADETVRKQQEALTRLQGYEVFPYSEALMYEMVKSGQYTVPEIVAKRQKEVTGYNMLQYLRDNPGDTQTLITAGFDPEVVTKLSPALEATKDYWIDDGFNAYGALIAGVDPKHIKTLTGKTEEEIKELPIPLAQFLEEYEKSHPKDLPKIIEAGEAAHILAVKKWKDDAWAAYDELYGKGAALKAEAIGLVPLFFLPSRALEPRVEIGDIEWWEWAIGGVQIAAITAPVWIPPAVRGIKWVFPKLKIGTHPFSEPAISRTQLQQTRMLGTKTITASEIGMSDAQFARFIKFRVTHPNTTPFHFKAMEAFEWEKMMAAVTKVAKAGQKPKVGIGGLTPAQAAEQAKILAEIVRQAKIKAAYPAVKAEWVEQLARVTAKQPLTASQIVEQAIKNEAMWRAMAEASIARVQPTGFYIPDYPFVIPLAISDLRISTHQLAGTQPLTNAQVQTIAKAANITEAKVRAMAKAGTLTTTLSNSATVARIIAKTQGLTLAQVKTLTEALTKTQGLVQAKVASLTKAQTKALADALTKAMVSEALAVETATSVAELTKVLPAEATQVATEAAVKAMTKAVAEGATKTEAKVAAQQAVQTALQTITAPPVAPTVAPPLTPVPTPTPAPTPSALIIPPFPYGVTRVGDERKEMPLPQGVIVFRMGTFWKHLPPPYTQKKFLTLPRGIIPMGAINTDLKSPQETLQIIGEPMAEVPESISADIGISDAIVFNRGQNIKFTPRGTLTDVGQRIESTTEGISIPARGTDEFSLSEYYKEERKQPFRRPEARKKGRSRKKRNWLHEATRPPTIQELMG